VYEALRDSPAWPRTAFIIVYDEHGGTFDHIKPPAATPPRKGERYADPADNRLQFGWDRLGPRVPAVVVSPLIEAGTIDSTVYDHTSVFRTLRERDQSLKSLTDRDASANGLGHLFRLDTPRADKPAVKRPAIRFRTRNSTRSFGRLLSNHNVALIKLANHLTTNLEASNTRSSFAPGARCERQSPYQPGSGLRPMRKRSSGTRFCGCVRSSPATCRRMRSYLRQAVAPACLALVAVSGREAVAQTESPPPDRSTQQVEVNKTLVEHVIDIFSSPVRVLTTAVVPTSGLAVGGGLDLTAEHEEFKAGGKISSRGYWRADVQLSTHPTPSSQLMTFGGMRHLPSLPNYGIGPDSSKETMATFDLDDSTAGGGGWIRHGRIGLAATGDVTLATSGKDSARAAEMRATFAPGELAGFGDRLTYWHSSVALDFNNSTPVDQPTRGIWYRLTIHKYGGLAGSPVSFTLADVDLRHYYPLPGRVVLGTQVDVKMSPRGDARTAPFFLLPYLGGDSTLEGFADYRFRDSNAALIRLQGRRALFSSIPIWKRTNAGPLYVIVLERRDCRGQPAQSTRDAGA
jgi:hypothetical protein